MFEKKRSMQASITRGFAAFALVSTIGASSNLSCLANDSALETSTRKPLEAIVQHDETLPGLPTDLRVGKKVDPTQLLEQTPDNNWFPIPTWLAGKWHSDSMTITNVTICETGKSSKVHVERKEVSDVVHGFQKDKSGQIWEFLQIPRVQKVAVEEGQCYLTCSREDVLRTDNTAVLLKILNNQITLNKGNKVIATNQVQQISNYLPLEDGLIRMEASLKNFDADGAPEQVQKAEKVISRIAPYESVDTKDGLDLKKLFVEYLKREGKSDLIP